MTNEAAREAAWQAYLDSKVPKGFDYPWGQAFNAGYDAGVADQRERYAALVEAVDLLSRTDAERARHDIDGQRLHARRMSEAWANVGEAMSAVRTLESLGAISKEIATIEMPRTWAFWDGSKFTTHFDAEREQWLPYGSA